MHQNTPEVQLTYLHIPIELVVCAPAKLNVGRDFNRGNLLYQTDFDRKCPGKRGPGTFRWLWSDLGYMAADLGKSHGVKSQKSDRRFVTSLLSLLYSDIYWRFKGVNGRATNDLFLTTHIWWSRLGDVWRGFQGYFCLKCSSCVRVRVHHRFQQTGQHLGMVVNPRIGQLNG